MPTILGHLAFKMEAGHVRIIWRGSLQIIDVHVRIATSLTLFSSTVTFLVLGTLGINLLPILLEVNVGSIAALTQVPLHRLRAFTLKPGRHNR